MIGFIEANKLQWKAAETYKKTDLTFYFLSSFLNSLRMKALPLTTIWLGELCNAISQTAPFLSKLDKNSLMNYLGDYIASIPHSMSKQAFFIHSPLQNYF